MPFFDVVVSLTKKISLSKNENKCVAALFDTLKHTFFFSLSLYLLSNLTKKTKNIYLGYKISPNFKNSTPNTFPFLEYHGSFSILNNSHNIFNLKIFNYKYYEGKIFFSHNIIINTLSRKINNKKTGDDDNDVEKEK
jgi:hypothetical protein